MRRRAGNRCTRAERLGPRSSAARARPTEDGLARHDLFDALRHGAGTPVAPEHRTASTVPDEAEERTADPALAEATPAEPDEGAQEAEPPDAEDLPDEPAAGSSPQEDHVPEGPSADDSHSPELVEVTADGDRDRP